MRNKTGLLLLFLMGLPGCTSGWALTGTLPIAGEALTGAATRYTDGGTIEIYGSRGTHCTGIFTYHSPTDGKGKLLCDDRRSGAFAINPRLKQGQGDLNGQAFSFTMGKARPTAAKDPLH
jgi:hypothetical protein